MQVNEIVISQSQSKIEATEVTLTQDRGASTEGIENVEVYIYI